MLRLSVVTRTVYLRHDAATQIDLEYHADGVRIRTGGSVGERNAPSTSPNQSRWPQAHSPIQYVVSPDSPPKEAVSVHGRERLPSIEKRGFLSPYRERPVVAVTRVTPSEPLVTRDLPEPPFSVDGSNSPCPLGSVWSIGPSGDRYRFAANEPLHSVLDLTVLGDTERTERRPDGRSAALSRVAARKSSDPRQSSPGVGIDAANQED